MQTSPIFCAFLLLCLKYSVTSTTVNFTITTLWNSTLITTHSPVQILLSSATNRSDLIIEIDAPFFHDPAPAMTPPGPFPELWNYEVVEVFLLSSSTNHYIELEFSPHGHYIVLLLVGQRKLLKQLLPLPEYHATILSENRWVGRAYIPCAHLPGRIDRFNAFAIHGQGENRSYEALYPAPAGSAKPDFHRLELFQPYDFDQLLDQSEKDGASWQNHASRSIAFSILLPILLLQIPFQWTVLF
ncbi:unnamed protein product [Adineta ricciae]|uniref:Uncharacterized protein n=1 Tax=Adineta ricciae TaxID=249248 RepID=A0A814TC67_ADIRI|nr:unnamed protein product [Adineta ricciae]CAF1159447.1 unnamed protein product [Adineta ricciae]